MATVWTEPQELDTTRARIVSALVRSVSSSSILTTGSQKPTR